MKFGYNLITDLATILASFLEPTRVCARIYSLNFCPKHCPQTSQEGPIFYQPILATVHQTEEDEELQKLSRHHCVNCRVSEQYSS